MQKRCKMFEDWLCYYIEHNVNSMLTCIDICTTHLQIIYDIINVLPKQTSKCVWKFITYMHLHVRTSKVESKLCINYIILCNICKYNCCIMHIMNIMCWLVYTRQPWRGLITCISEFTCSSQLAEFRLRIYCLYVFFFLHSCLYNVICN